MSLWALKTLGEYRTSCIFYLCHFVACGRVPDTYRIMSMKPKLYLSVPQGDLVRSREARHMHDLCLGAVGSLVSAPLLFHTTLPASIA
jgi:hypothetical protein